MRIVIILMFIVALYVPQSVADENLNSQDECRDDIVGYWLTPRDENSGRTSIVEFIKKDGKYFAYQVVFMDSLPGGKDENNQIYSLRDREVLGSVYIYNLEKNTQTSYIKGQYYSFNTGRVFHLHTKLNCNNLILTISIDNAGILGSKKVYKYVSPNDMEFYIKNKKPEIDFSGVD